MFNDATYSPFDSFVAVVGNGLALESLILRFFSKMLAKRQAHGTIVVGVFPQASSNSALEPYSTGNDNIQPFETVFALSLR